MVMVMSSCCVDELMLLLRGEMIMMMGVVYMVEAIGQTSLGLLLLLPL